MKLIKKIFNRLRRSKLEAELSSDLLDLSQREELVAGIKLAPHLEENIRLVQDTLGRSVDLVVHRFNVGRGEVSAAAVYLQGMINSQVAAELLRTVGIDLYSSDMAKLEQNSIYQVVRDRVVNLTQVEETSDIEQLLVRISRGEMAVLFNGTGQALLCSLQGFITRSITEPEAETVIRGSREGFVESIITNISLLRRRLPTPHFWIEGFEVGHLTRTKVALAYIKGLAAEQLIGEVRSRIKGINIDGVLESGYIEDYLQDQPLTIFPQVFRTERPDRVAAGLLEGRAAILVDNTPFTLVVPNDLPSMVQGPDDYYELVPIGAFLRLLRSIAFTLSILLPGFYVAVLNYHQEMMPAGLLLKIIQSREGTPFPLALEIFLMEGVFEILREAGLRLPKAIGPAITIVGALIVGDAAIRAGLVSPAAVIIIAFTAISSFTVPVFSLGIAARQLRFVFIILGAVFGLFGLQFGIILLLTHLCALRSFGLPYMTPLAPLVPADMKDSFLRLYWWLQVRRPRLIGFREPVRQEPGPRPGKRSGPENERQE